MHSLESLTFKTPVPSAALVQKTGCCCLAKWWPHAFWSSALMASMRFSSTSMGLLTAHAWI